MVINNNTLEKINYVKDLDYEFNIKLIIICLLLLFSVATIYFSRRIDRSDQVNDTYYYIMISFAYIFVFFSFLSPFLLLRTVSVSFLLELVFVGYGVVLTLFSLYAFYWLVKKFLSKYFGVKFNDNPKEQRSRKDYRRYT